MAFKALCSVAGFDLPSPSTYKGTTSTIVDSGRNVQGVVVGAVIRENVAKIEMTWKFISVENWAAIMACFDSTRGGNFYNSVNCFLQDIGDWDTRTMYVSDRTADVFLRDKQGKIRGYLNATLSLVEV